MRAMNSMGAMAAKITGVSAAVGLLTSGLGVAAIATKSFSKALDFEAELSTIKALTGATADEMKQMEDLALSMGAKTKYSALEAASGIEELLKAGLSPATVKAGGLEAALNLATAGGLGLAEAAETMSTALNAFKKDGMTAARASDLLAGTANASATGVQDLRQSLAAVSSVAAGIGMNFEDTNIAMGLFANNGIKGSDAGTSLKTMLQNLQPGTKEQIALFNKLGITTNGTGNKFFTASGKIESLANVADTLRKSLGSMNDMQRQAALEAMFGTDAIRAGNILYEEGADGVRKFYDEMSNVTAYRVAKEKMDNGRGAIEQFKGAIETLQIQAVKPLLPAIKATFNALGDYVNAKTPQITAAMERMADGAKRYLKEHFIDNQSFRDLGTFQQKFEFVISDLKKTFDFWYNNGGSKQIENATSALIGFVSTALSNSSEKLGAVGVNLGKSLASGMLSGLEQFANENPKMAALMTYIATPGGPAVKAAAAIAIGSGSIGAVRQISNDIQSDAAVFKEKGASAGIENFLAPLNRLLHPEVIRDENGKVLGGKALLDYKKANPTQGPQVPNGHAGGLSRVPYNGYTARLHVDEEVLTKTDADKRRMGNGSGSSVLVTGNTFNVRSDNDIDAIAKALATQAWEARGAVAR
ncbi:phage tail tape measure protein [Paenibacillus sp. HWE-109]|uniref:phage tail tape measure protein n=1 Tax=Paenibacillus sp. HWE-109 TaxID=1306526 RepID=UPI001EDEE510|nr:phage tail tape measure protein [Paenibacillus sp. HWE-109]UKS30151.1 phage tail tape measure protein [Paenibacillus sp. HWE-109]